jgi:multidrug efflux pump subunit AcrA (membrane-fusion protein)
VEAGEERKVLTVPETAMFAQQRKRYVYVVREGAEGSEIATAQLQEIKPGPLFDGFVTVENDKELTTADRVIVDNLLRVRPGAKVKLKQ